MTRFMQKAAILAIGIWGTAQAANDGTLGTLPSGASRGDFTITMDLKGVARIFGLKDFTITPANLSPHQAICIYANTDNFTINATSGNSKFELQDSSQNIGASYSLELFENNTASGSAVKKWENGGAAADALVTKKSLDDTDDETQKICSVGNFSLKVNAALKKGVKQGSYTDTVTLTITPQ